jgi:hypothetical protein
MALSRKERLKKQAQLARKWQARAERELQQRVFVRAGRPAVFRAWEQYGAALTPAQYAALLFLAREGVLDKTNWGTDYLIIPKSDLQSQLPFPWGELCDSLELWAQRIDGLSIEPTPFGQVCIRYTVPNWPASIIPDIEDAFVAEFFPEIEDAGEVEVPAEVLA